MTLKMFRNADGIAGARQHLFLLPTVVCANQVAMDVSVKELGLKRIEHQHGCAQIGADLTQTTRVFTRMALHPNVFASAMIGLGCEGIMTPKLFQDARHQTAKPLDLFVIQELGGTARTTAAVQQWVADLDAKRQANGRSDATWSEVTIGFLLDDPLFSTTLAWDLLVGSLLELGARVVLGEGAAWSAPIPSIPYASQSTEPISRMTGGTSALEVTTGLAAVGCQVIIHVATRPHAFGSPLAPVYRLATDPEVFHRFSEDFDGAILHDMDIQYVIEHVQRILQGQQTVAETYDLDDFALYRIGPTM